MSSQKSVDDQFRIATWVAEVALLPENYEVARHVADNLPRSLRPVALMMTIFNSGKITRGELAFFGVAEHILDSIEFLRIRGYQPGEDLETADEYINRIVESGDQAVILTKFEQLQYLYEIGHCGNSVALKGLFEKDIAALIAAVKPVA